MRTFNIQEYNRLLSENIRDNYYFEIDPIILALKGSVEPPEPLFWDFVRKHRETGSIATSMDRLVYMNTSDIQIDRNMLMGVSPAVNPNQMAKLFGARLYVELQDETGSIVHPDGGKSIKALHPAGRTRMSWDSLWDAMGEFGVENLILSSELSDFKEANGYHVEETI